MLGIAGGFMFTGLLLGALSGSVLLLIGLVIVGLAILGFYAASIEHRGLRAASCKLKEYPPYGY